MNRGRDEVWRYEVTRKGIEELAAEVWEEALVGIQKE